MSRAVYCDTTRFKTISSAQCSGHNFTPTYRVAHMPLPEYSVQFLDDDALIRFVGDNFTQELEHLKRATPSAEFADADDTSDDNRSPSYRLFHAEYAEVNRTLVSLLCLKWILDGSYEIFLEAQPLPSRLSRQSFDDLTTLFKDWLPSNNDVYLLLVAIVVADLGKDESLAEEVHHRNGLLSSTKLNHDQLVYEAAKARLIPCLEALQNSERRDVVCGLDFAARLNIPQLAQAENVPGSLSSVASFKSQTRAMHLKFLEVFLDVAGAAAQINYKESFTMTEDVYQTYRSVMKALTAFIDVQSMTEVQSYDMVLDSRASLIHSRGGERLLMSTQAIDRALLRLVCMGRVADAQLAKTFADAFLNLGDDKHDLIVRLNAHGLSRGDCTVLPYYAPAIFAKVLKLANKPSNQQEKDQRWLRLALFHVMRLLSRVCKRKSESENDEAALIIERDMSFVLEVITGTSFVQNPAVLDNVQLPWEK